jgi:hypothetical protein
MPFARIGHAQGRLLGEVGVMTRVVKPVPIFTDEAEERRFWETHDSTDYVDWSGALRVRLPNLKLTSAADVNSDRVVPEERK